MAPHNLYTLYKRDTRHLLYWLINASNNIIASLDNGSAGMELNTTVQTTVAGILAMARLVGEHLELSDIPDIIFYLFQAVIRARTVTHETFSQSENDSPGTNAEIEKSNAAHKHFIDVLSQALEALGGTEKAAGQKEPTEANQQEVQGDLDELLHFANKFSALTIDGGLHDSSNDSRPEDARQRTPRKQKKISKGRKRNKGKGKMGKSQKRGQKKGQQKKTAATSSSGQVDLEDCRIIEDDGGCNADYRMASLAVVQEWVDHRAVSQCHWCYVAFDGFNSAVAAGITKAATQMLQRSELALAIEFPHHDDYFTIVDTLTQGDLKGSFIRMTVAMPDQNGRTTVRTVGVDVKEQLMMPAYEDLLDFLRDFQKSHSGKPTKPMLAQIKDWNPYYNLQKATPAQRVEWRRSYTINWLYELVNVFTAPTTPGNEAQSKRYTSHDIDWNSKDYEKHYQGVFGLNEFACAIMSLAMQKQGTDIRRKIMPNLVFQLQCMVDAFTATRGWVNSFIDGQRVRSPPLSFSPRRDIVTFLGSEHASSNNGWLHAVRTLKQVSMEDNIFDDESIHHLHSLKFLELVQNDFIQRLGGSRHIDGMTSGHSSHFAKFGANGLWEFSPVLCGSALLETLEISHSLSIGLWDEMLEPALLMHLQNMLLQTGYIEEPVDIYSRLPGLFYPEMFKDDKPPLSDFSRAMLDHIDARYGQAPKRQRPKRQATAKSAAEVYRLLRSDNYQRRKPGTMLSMWRRANWNPDRIPDEEVVFSLLFGVRIAQTKHIVDPLSGEMRLQETPLVSMVLKHHPRALEQLLLEGSKSIRAVLSDPADPVPEDLPLKSARTTSPSGVDIDSRKLLSLVKWDLHADILDSQALSGLNVLRLAVHFILTFKEIENTLRKMRNPSYLQVYESGYTWSRPKPVVLTCVALAGHDQECLRTMAKILGKPQDGVEDYKYWDKAGGPSKPNIDVSMCVVS
ncbi:hypothetical protein PG993_008401 [Apiospora rasikravindrae]|uniref:DUF6604 domain-containing protein n=1 Tax=Apiospora rasikravindrae TaxID=990691 RepID=A0ABR1T086_9PEZI